jgi:hypothetical protein
MKKTLFILLTLFIILCANAQSSTWDNYDYVSLYAKFLHKTDTVHLHKGDLEIRLWFNDGANRINTTYFISLTKLNGKWDASYYAFTSFPIRSDSIIVNRKEPFKLNYDSLYNQMVRDSLLMLNSDSINEVMNKNGQHRWMWTDAEPTNYTIQILTSEKRKTLNFKCPGYFYKEAKIAEFKFPLKVIGEMLTMIGLEPC